MRQAGRSLPEYRALRERHGFFELAGTPDLCAEVTLQPVARYGLLAAATAVGWSRINDNRHWLSDVAAGAVIGITSAKFASGRWRVFGIRAPSFIVGPTGAMGLSWHTSF